MPNKDEVSERFKMWREDVLRVEIRNLRGTLLRVNQWGVTVLASIQTVLYFIRRDVLEHLHAEKSNVLWLPRINYLMGTLFLFVVATLFCVISFRPSIRLRGYRDELKRFGVSGIAEREIHPVWARIVNFSLFYAFPFFDIVLRVFLNFNIQFR